MKDMTRAIRRNNKEREKDFERNLKNCDGKFVKKAKATRKKDFYSARMAECELS